MTETPFQMKGSGCPGNLSCRPKEEIDDEDKGSEVLEVAAAHKRVYELLKFVVGSDLDEEERKPNVLTMTTYVRIRKESITTIKSVNMCTS